MSDISEANTKIARQEHIKTQQERINQLERELEETTTALEKQLLNYSEIVTENKSLKNWKTEQLAVEAEWNPQTIGGMLGMLPGVSIRKNIESCIAQLQAENERLCEEIEFDKALDTKIIKDQARKEGRMEAARECYIIAQNILVRAMKCDNFIGNAMDDLLDEIKDKFGLEG